MLLTILVAIYFWQRYFKSRNLINIGLAVFMLSLSVYFYSTAKLFSPLLGLYFLFTWKPPLKHSFFAILFGFLLLLPMFLDTIQGKAGFRFSYISIFTEPHREQTTDNLRYQDVILFHPNEIGLKTPTVSYLFHNKYQLIAQKFIQNYLQSFSPEFLFISGDKNQRQGFGNHGLLYVIDFFTIILGIILHSRHPTRIGKLFLFLLIMGPIPFALTRDSSTAHATRLILLLPSFIYFSSLAVTKKPIFFLPIYILLFVNFWHYYQYHYPQDSARTWHANSKEAIIAIQNSTADFIYFSDQAEPFMLFFLYYFPYIPTDSLTKHITSVNSDFFDGSCLDGKYCFGHITSQNFPTGSKVQVVVPKSAIVQFPQIYQLTNSIPKKYINSEEYSIYSNY